MEEESKIIPVVDNTATDDNPPESENSHDIETPEKPASEPAQYSVPTPEPDSSDLKVADSSIIGQKEKKTGKTFLVVFLAILACAGIGFGVYEFLENQKLSRGLTGSSDLKVEIKNSDGTTSTLETDQISINNQTSTVTISDSVVSGNPVIYSPDKSISYGLGFSSSSVIDDEDKSVNISLTNGEITECSIIQNYRLVSNCTISGISGKIYKIVEIGAGHVNTGNSIAFILEDGSVEYIPLYDAVKNNDFSVRGKLKLKGPVKDIFTIGIGYIPQDGEEFGGGAGSTLFVFSDNSYVAYDDSMLE